MRTLNELAWKYVEPIFYAKKSAWVCSPWISKSYAEKLYDLSRRGIEVRIITSDDVYNAETYSFLSQLSQTTNFIVHFIKKDAVHSKIYVIDDNYAITGAVNLTYTGLNKQTNNFTIAENQEVEPIVKEFMRLWIGYKSENVRPTQSIIKNILPIIPYEKAYIPGIRNGDKLEITSAELIINPYYKIGYSLLENVRLPWYQQTTITDKGTVVIDAKSGEVLNTHQSKNHTFYMIIKDVCNLKPIREIVIEPSENYKLSNQEWESKVDGYKAEALAINYIKEKNQKQIPYTERDTTRYQSYLPSPRAITILFDDPVLVPTWHFLYTYKGTITYEKIQLASSGTILKTSFYENGAICEDCGKSISKDDATHCPTCNEWLCPSEMIVCSSCNGEFHKVHLNKTCPICNGILCGNCAVICPICKKEYGKNHSITCRDCGLILCSNCIITSGLILKRNRCPRCDKKSKKK